MRERLDIGLLPALELAPVEWRLSEGLVGYEEALATMEERAAAIAAGTAAELAWLLEHPPLYTAGTSAQHNDALTRRDSDGGAPAGANLGLRGGGVWAGP